MYKGKEPARQREERLRKVIGSKYKQGTLVYMLENVIIKSISFMATKI